MSGIGDKGEVPAQLAYANSVQIGDLEFHNCPLSIIERVPRGTDGVIGTDVFSQFLIELDFPASMLTLSRLPPRPGQTVSKASLKLGNDDPATETGEKRSSDSAPDSSGPSRRSPSSITWYLPSAAFAIPGTATKSGTMARRHWDADWLPTFVFNTLNRATVVFAP